MVKKNKNIHELVKQKSKNSRYNPRINSKNNDENNNTEYQQLKIISYNINGLANKVIFNDFFAYLKSFDIFILLETHVEESSSYSKYFGDYDLHWNLASRRSRYGRAIEGYVCGVSKHLKKKGLDFSFQSREEVDFIVIKDLTYTFSLFPT